MGKIEGTYALEKSEKFDEILMKMGVPEEHAKLANTGKCNEKVKLDGKKVLWTHEGLKTIELVFVDGEEIEETAGPDGKQMTLTKVEGDVIKQFSTHPKGKMERIHTFTDAGLKSEISLDCGIKATRLYKRV